MSSGEHSLAGTELAGTTLFSDKDFPPVRAALPEEEIQKDCYLRSRRLRRSSDAGKSMSPGEHSLAGTEIAGTTFFSRKDFPPVRGGLAGGGHAKRRSPPTTAASPEFGLRTTQPPPANIRSQELSWPAQSVFRRAGRSSEHGGSEGSHLR